MPQFFLRHLIDGGWATDFGPSAEVAIQPVDQSTGVVRVPFLSNADNMYFELGGGNVGGDVHKIWGTDELTATAIVASEEVRGLFDAWLLGTAGSPSQHRIAHVGTKIVRDNANVTFTDLFTGLTNDANPDYTLFEDIVIIASDSSDVPRSWDGTTAQNLAGSPPNFAFSCEHHNRVWAAGVDANPSTLYYSVLLDGEDWTGSGSGSIQISPSDGDRITGIVSWNNELIVFKGPYKGSIHRITGTAPTGSDAFARRPVVRGVGAVWNHLVFPFGNDIGFMWSDGSVWSLRAVEQFGDMQITSLSQPINREFLQKRLNHSVLKKARVAVDDLRSLVIFLLPVDGESEPNFGLAMDYRFTPPRWAPWPALTGFRSIATVIDSSDNDRRTLFLGGDDGKIYRFFRSNRSIRGAAISFVCTLPHVAYSFPQIEKTLSAGSIGIQPLNDGNLTFGWQRDDRAQQTKTVSQGGSDVLGSADANEFTLGTSTLGGARFVERFFPLEEGGSFRSIQLEVKNATNNEDVQMRSISIRIEADGLSLEN